MTEGRVTFKSDKYTVALAWRDFYSLFSWTRRLAADGTHSVSRLFLSRRRAQTLSLTARRPLVTFTRKNVDRCRVAAHFWPFPRVG